MSLTYEQRQQLRQAVDRRRRENVSFLSVEKREAELEVSLTRAFDVTSSFKPELVPTLSSYEKYWTRKRMVAAAREWYRQHGRSPSRTDWAKAGAYHPSGSTVYEHLGSWNALLDLAGLSRNPTGTGRNPNRWTQESIVLAVGRWAEKHGRPPTYGDWVIAGEDHPNSRIVARYCGSFAAAWEMVA